MLFQKQIQIHINALDRQIESINNIIGSDEEIEEENVIDNSIIDNENSEENISPKFNFN
jgi:hypothetical protein